VLLGQLGINLLPLGLEQAPEDGVVAGVSGAFQIIEGGCRLEAGEISVGEIEGGEFSDRLAGRVVQAADQHADVAQGVLLDQCGCPYASTCEAAAGRNLSRYLFAPTTNVEVLGLCFVRQLLCRAGNEHCCLHCSTHIDHASSVTFSAIFADFSRSIELSPAILTCQSCRAIEVFEANGTATRYDFPYYSSIVNRLRLGDLVTML
jgi:hypothetical protein